MDVMRTGVSVLGTLEPEKPDHSSAGARDIADRLMASLGSMLLYWHHFSRHGRRIETETDDDSIGGDFFHLPPREKTRAGWGRALHTSLLLLPEHGIKTSTFTRRPIARPRPGPFKARCGGR